MDYRWTGGFPAAPASDGSMPANPIHGLYSSSCEETSVGVMKLSEHCSTSEDSLDFSDAALRYISRILMEEDIDEKSCIFHDSLDLQMAEKSLYDVLGQEYPPPSLDKYPDLCTSRYPKEPAGDQSLKSISGSQLSHSSSESSLVSTASTSTSDSQDRPQLTGLPLRYGLETYEIFEPDQGGSSNGEFRSGLERRKTRAREEQEEEEDRSRKQAAVYVDTELRSETFDIVLLSSGGEGLARLLSLRASLKDGVSKNLRNGSQGRRSRKKKPKEKKELIDLRDLLIQCAQAVASNDIKSANLRLEEIRRFASPLGDGMQRMARCFADGLEARLLGTGPEICRGLGRRRLASEMLKAYQLYLAACPFQRISNVVSNKSIRVAAATAKRLHIIDFGIFHGFQWPTLIQILSRRPGGPPRLRITGVDLPQPGFRPGERVEETGRRLANYAGDFNVPFEYRAVAKRWESIGPEELRVDKGDQEVTIVNCLYRLKNMYDETVLEDNSRDIVLSLIRKLNPDLFIHGVVNGAHNAPFFVTRFREALFHFSALFDMLDTIVPRESHERMLIEKDLFGWEAMNCVACEGWERVERPETYKQWQVRNLRAGFQQVPVEREIVRFAARIVETGYHKDFVMDEIGKWLLQGWKGRFLYAISTWKPA
ncbi:hypothetical protein SAY87_026721 [Trapa incisa]|uniref:Scarecrow-like protein 9 n=1 Tax=Trapa incisa TaxID=236973 RepID=A0AAN7JLL7_9MYRT|nr:hypothetical protein SAY87_026721 [Trapa incisa]